MSEAQERTAPEPSDSTSDLEKASLEAVYATLPANTAAARERLGRPLTLAEKILINHLVFHGRRAAFIMELPLYHIPNWRTIGLVVWHRSWSFLRKAGTLIVVVSTIIWALSSSRYDPCSIVLTPARSAASIPGLPWQWAATMRSARAASARATGSNSLHRSPASTRRSSASSGRARFSGSI